LDNARRVALDEANYYGSPNRQIFRFIAVGYSYS
jgi:hypothetical protein